MASALLDLWTKGYVVIHGFLDSNEIEFFKNDYDAVGNADNSNYSMRVVTEVGLTRISPTLKSIADAVCRETPITVDILWGGVYFATGAVNFEWHQDHESFFILQDHLNQLNFWIPLVKPEPNRSGICVINFEDLRRKSSQAHSDVVGKGAHRFSIADGKTRVFDDSTDAELDWLFSVEELMEAPDLRAGDLLLMRGDAMHRTQDADTDRVA